MLWIISAIIISYLIGSIPTSYIFGRILKGIDIRQFGSGNVGATNAFRVLGKAAGISVLILDIVKGFIPVVFIADVATLNAPFILEQNLRILLGISSVLGHNWTVFLRFRGGKGVATTLGMLLGLSIRVPGLKLILGLAILTWLIVFIALRIVSIASVITGISVPVYTLIFKQSNTIKTLSVLLCAFIIFRHKSNLKRFLRNKEPRLF